MTLAALLQLSSATLPVGAFSYSQGLEAAVDRGIVTDEATATDWIDTVLCHGIATTEAVVIARAFDALTPHDARALARINRRHLASRETRELLAETLQMGRSMRLLIVDDLAVAPTVRAQLHALETEEGLSYSVVWAVAAHARAIDVKSALIGYLYSALENLTLAALKTVPLGQNAGQRLLHQIVPSLGALAQTAMDCPLDDMTNFLPQQIWASTYHETQHTRLFRS